MLDLQSIDNFKPGAVSAAHRATVLRTVPEPSSAAPRQVFPQPLHDQDRFGQTTVLGQSPKDETAGSMTEQLLNSSSSLNMHTFLGFGEV